MTSQFRLADGVCHLSGELDFNTVPQIWKVSEMMFASLKSNLLVDMRDVTRADSAGLALLVGWVRRGRAAGVETSFSHIPEQLMAIARVSGVEGMLPLHAG